MVLPDIVVAEIIRLLDDLVAGNFDELQHDGRGGRLLSSDFSRVIDEYGKTLVPPPQQIGDMVDVYPITGEDSTWAIDIPLWTREEGRSDLTLSITARALSPSRCEVKIEDMHVL